MLTQTKEYLKDTAVAPFKFAGAGLKDVGGMIKYCARGIKGSVFSAARFGAGMKNKEVWKGIKATRKEAKSEGTQSFEQSASNKAAQETATILGDAKSRPIKFRTGSEQKDVLAQTNAELDALSSSPDEPNSNQKAA